MSTSFENSLIDAYIIQRDSLIAADDLRRCLEESQRQGSDLLSTLRDQHLINENLALEIESRRLQMQDALSALTGDTSIQPDDEELETLNESISPQVSPSPQPGSSSGETPATGLASRFSSGTAFDARYEKSQPHAEGGLGKVWLATDQELLRKVALKEIRPELADDTQCQQRFLREAEITGALEHPGIVPVYGLGHYSDGRPFYAMRYIEGQTLKEAIDAQFQTELGTPFRDKQWMLGFRKLLNRFIDVCETIAFAHSKCVIHRDIKPSNIMLGAFGETLVVDWGLAKRLDAETDAGSEQTSAFSKLPSLQSQLTMLGAAVGTPAYMSPEQATGGAQAAVDQRSDVFSLGATFFHLITGRPPSANSNTFPALSSGDSAGQQEYEEALDRVPAPLAAICRKSMLVSVTERYQSARELSNDIEAWLNDQPVTAYDESWLEKTNRWVRMHPTLLTSTSVGALLIMFAGFWGALANLRYEEGIRNEKLEREMLADKYRQETENMVNASISSARLEIQNDRFESALDFLGAAQDALASEESVDQESARTVAGMLDRTQRLVDFQHYTSLAEELTFMDSSRRSSILLQRALKRIGVFQRLEWWNALPSQELDALQIHRLRTQVYRAMFLLTALRLKETLPADLDVIEMMKLVSNASKESNQASLVLFDLLDAYRLSQGSQLGRDFAVNRLNLLNQVLRGVTFQQRVINWSPKNASDLYIMGTALGYMVVDTDAKTRKQFEVLLGVADAEAVSQKMLTQVSELQRDHYWTQLVRAFFEGQRKEYDAAWRSYSHTISLAPDSWMGYNWYGLDLRAKAIDLPEGSDERAEFFQRSLTATERAVDLNPTSVIALSNLGDTLTWTTSDPRAVLASYQRALSLQEPLYAINDAVVEAVARNTTINIRNWCEATANNGWDQPETYRCLAHSELLLGRLDRAFGDAEKTLQKSPDDSIAQMIQACFWQAHGDHQTAESIFGELAGREKDFNIHRYRAANLEAWGKWELARKSFAQAAELAEAQWQSFIAHRGLARISLRTNASNTVEEVATAIEMALVEPLSDLRELAEENGHRQARELLEKHRRSLQPVLELNSNELPKEAPLLNGGFELGLTRIWAGTLDKIHQPAWQHFGPARAIARISQEVVHSGQRALHIIQAVRIQSGSFSQLSQKLPLYPDQRYQLVMWIRSNSSRGEALRVLLNDNTLLTSPGGTYDWQRLSVEFTADQQEVEFFVRCVDQCDIFIDDITITRLADVAGEQVTN